jgi:hypothetical protein
MHRHAFSGLFPWSRGRGWMSMTADIGTINALNRSSDHREGRLQAAPPSVGNVPGEDPMGISGVWDASSMRCMRDQEYDFGWGASVLSLLRWLV